MDAPNLSPAAPRDISAVARMARVGRNAAVTAGLVGLLALGGWVLRLEWLRSAGQRFETQPNAAVGLVLAALATVLACRRDGASRNTARVLAVIVAALGAVTLLEHLTGADLLLDRTLLPTDAPVANVAGIPGRMGAPAALDLLLCGVALLALSAGPRGAPAAQTIALAAAPLPLLVLVAYAYDVRPLYAAPFLSAVAFPTALALLLLDVGILLARPGDGFVANLATAGGGSAIARRMLLYAVALPIAVGWIALTAHQARSESAFAVSLVVVALTLALVLLVLRDALVLDRLEAAKLHAQSEREASRDELAKALRREQEARSHAESASRARDEFLNTLSHELRTPLNAILGWTQLLRDGGTDPARLARGLAVVDRNGRALAQVVSDLLDMSRIARGVIQLERMELDPVAAVDRAVEAVRPAANAKGVALVRAVPAPVPAVLGDPVRVQQIAWNLLTNAVKFTPGGGRVAVGVAADGGDVVLTVEDSGAGIPPEFLPHVFDRFRQADGSDSRRHGGLGLGLALTRELVVLHGGAVEVASAGEGRGATFRVMLPQAPRQAEVAPPPRRDRPQLGGARILVVDDEADARELLVQLLQSWGARPAGVASAREALAAAALEKPDLLVSDIAMPGEDGCAMLQELRRIERALGQLPVPSLALTAFGRPEDRRRVLAAGFDAHVAKPVEPDELRATIAALLRREPQVIAPARELRPVPGAPGRGAGGAAAAH
ncbi:hybrid sensor histidine kinase/response regulator [Anaeromyxobacter oryzae]|uniref:histidine kinase n=1 Tax=Anaeromyxobacter oryzae TaxID=2918170 RepID=A0ABM7WSW9_9BACT|nr:ATP-binding protein [Anaeromyxobacter oryzae]BDG02581.1 hypothetical protein AMOR_15770 [Anaeromyxobacter oryzae]